LWIGIHQKRVQSGTREGMGEVDGECGFTHTSLLAYDGDAYHAATGRILSGDYSREDTEKVFSSSLGK
jgi:hypothetical protein